MTLDEVRALIATLPEAREVDDPQGATWRVRTWFLTRIAQDGESLVLTAIDFDERELLCELEPQTFHFDPRLAHHQVVHARIATVNPGTLERLLRNRWRIAATKKAVRAWEERL